MKITGYGEFHQMRKAVQKDEPRGNSGKARDITDQLVSDASSDAVEISPEARFKMKFRQIPDVRQERLDQIKEKMANGTLVTPDSLERGTSKMLLNMLGNTL